MTKGRKYAIALTAALGLIMGILDNTIVNIALVPISDNLKVSLETVQWLVTGYFLSQAAVIPVAGYLGNRYGSRRIFILCVALFTVGSLLCGISQDATWLIIFRVIQGVGAGALFPLGQAIAIEPFESHERAGAMSLLVIPVLLGPVLGPILGGWLNDSFGWHYLFLINVPIGIITVFLAWRIIPDNKPSEATGSNRFDYVGLVLSTLGILAVVYAFTIVNQTNPSTVTQANPAGSSYGWSYWLVWALAGVGVILLAIFAFYELRLSDPILDLTIFKKYSFTIATVVTCVISGTVFGALLLLPVFFQTFHTPKMSALDTGLALVPQGIGAMIGAGSGGFLFSKLGGRITTAVGGLLIVIALWQFTFLDTAKSDGWTMAPWNFILGVGLGLTFIPSQTLAFLSLTGPALTKASSLFNVARQIASSLATAVIITLLGQQTTTHVQDFVNAAVQNAMKSLPAGTPVPSSTSPQAQQFLQQILKEVTPKAGTLAITDLFGYLAVATILVAILAFALPSRKQVAAIQEEQGAEGVEMALIG